MQLYDPFPIEDFPPRAREAILAEFQGHHPTVLEVVRVPDTYWLEVPDIGPTTVAKLRSLTQGMRRKIRLPSLSGLSDLEILARRDFLQAELRRIRGELKANTAELQLRGIAVPAQKS